MEVECCAKFHPERLHVTANTSSVSTVPLQKPHTGSGRCAEVFSVVMVSRLFGISRKTFYKYRHQAEQGSLASFDCTPLVHGLAKPPQIIAAVLRAKAQYPSFGKQRLANVLYHQGVLISPNTVQRI